MQANGTPALRLGGFQSLTGRRRRASRDDVVIAKGDACLYFYKVVSGTVRTVKLLSENRRHGGAFHLPGEVFGLESRQRHQDTAEAVENVELLLFPRVSLVHLVQANASFGEEIIDGMLISLDRAHDRMAWLGRATAPEKVASFLLDLGVRLSGGFISKHRLS